MIETRGASRIRPSGLAPSSSRADTPPEGWEVLSSGNPAHGPRGRRSVTRSADVVWEQRLDALEARIEHLEGELEGLQDAVYRHAVLEDENIGELRRRMEPEQMARELSRDARRRGL